MEEEKDVSSTVVPDIGNEGEIESEKGNGQ